MILRYGKATFYSYHSVGIMVWSEQEEEGVSASIVECDIPALEATSRKPEVTVSSSSGLAITAWTVMAFSVVDKAQT